MTGTQKSVALLFVPWIRVSLPFIFTSILILTIIFVFDPGFLLFDSVSVLLQCSLVFHAAAQD